MRFPRELRFLAAGLVLALALPAVGALAADAEPPAADKPADKAPEAKAGQTANGLQLTVSVKERTFRMGGDAAAERKVSVPTLELKNVSDKPIVLGFQLGAGRVGGPGGFGGPGGPGRPGGAGGAGGAEAGPVKVFAKDAEGKEVTQPEGDRPARPEGPRAEDQPLLLTVLKPGKTIEQPLIGYVRLQKDGKYTIWAELEVKAVDEILPGLKPWSGKLKSNEVEYDYKRLGGRGDRGNRGGGGGGGGGQAPAPAPAPADEKANF
jgi:hypothetical protein